MHSGLLRFISNWGLIGVVLFYSVGSALIAHHTKRIFKPASAGGSEYRREYAGRHDEADRRKLLVEATLQNSTSDLIKWGSEESDLTLYDVAFGAEYFYEEDDMAKSNQGRDAQNNDGDTEKKDETEEDLTRIQTKLKCVETVLKKAVIEAYCVDGQTKGLQLTGLDEISEAKELQINSGDIILAVNGNTLSSKKDAYEIFLRARKEPIMIIDLLQDGKTKKLLLAFE